MNTWGGSPNTNPGHLRRVREILMVSSYEEAKTLLLRGYQFPEPMERHSRNPKQLTIDTFSPILPTEE